MRHFIIASTLIVALAALSGCAKKEPEPAKETPEQMAAALKAVDDHFMDALAKKDVNGMMECYWNSPDALLIPPDTLDVKGWDNIKAYWTRFVGAVELKDAQLVDTHYEAVDSLGYATGTVTGMMTPPGGQSMQVTIRYSEVFGKRDGKWVYLVDHTSMPPPPPPAGGKEMKKK